MLGEWAGSCVTLTREWMLREWAGPGVTYKRSLTVSLAPQLRGVQGLTRSQFDELGTAVRGGAGHISDDIFVHGSRASGTARAASDIDIAVRVGPDKFDDLIRSRFGTPNPGSAKERTMLHAIQTGKIHSGEAGLRGLRKQLEKSLGFDVDISVIRRGGPFDQGPRIPLGGG